VWVAFGALRRFGAAALGSSCGVWNDETFYPRVAPSLGWFGVNGEETGLCGNPRGYEIRQNEFDFLYFKSIGRIGRVIGSLGSQVINHHVCFNTGRGVFCNCKESRR
jgi:hypothetical protein